jgi:hypothetical protein
MAITIFILTLLMGSILYPLTAQLDQNRVTHTERQLEQIKEALIGFAIANHYFPCPAVSASNGVEDRTGTTCTGGKRAGLLPWVTLGLDQADAWDDLFRYSVAAPYSDSGVPFALNTVGDITIRTRDSAGTLVSLSNSDIPVVVLSHGKNGYGATTRDGAARFSPGAWAGDEKDNATKVPEKDFVFRPRTDSTAAAGGEFDDIVVWISPNILNSRMVAAGQLP